MKIFCSGIGGIGLSAYASHMKLRGHDVSGTDRSESIVTKELGQLEIPVSLHQDGSMLQPGTDLFVYSEAIPESSPERTKAKELGIRQISYFAALGELTKGARLIAVCGTHGKSSTTAMAAKVLVDAGLDPNVVVGTRAKDLGNKNWRIGESNLWVVEACEYRRSFLFLDPEIILMTNADGDHFDWFKDQSEYEAAFVDFCKKLPKDGLVIFHQADLQSRNIVERSAKRSIDADALPLPELTVPGTHMRSNARLVLGLAEFLNIDPKLVKKSLKAFSGTWRRMEVKGTTKAGVTVIDDYAHHPVEIRATLSALRQAYPERRIICVYQPHTHDRTLKLWDQFASSFGDADEIYLTDIYDARPDTEHKRADIAALASAIQKRSGKPCSVLGNLQKAEQHLCTKVLKQHDIVVIMGAGTITDLAERLV